MKKFYFISAALMAAQTLIFAQTKTPASVIDAFKNKFPNATVVKWDKENAHEYEASFTWNGSKFSSNFSDMGEWLETESAITFDQLPEKVKQTFNKGHKEEKIKAVAKIENSKGQTKYEVEVKKMEKTIELFYNTDGTELKD